MQASVKNTEKRLKWYARMMRMKVEHILTRMLNVDIPGKRRAVMPKLR